MVGKRSQVSLVTLSAVFRVFCVSLGRFWGSLGRHWGVHGVPWGVPGLLQELSGSSVGTFWGSVGIPGVLLVALEGVFSFLGRPGDGFREDPGNSGSRFGSILDDFLVIFGDIFRLRFLTDF